MTNPKLSPADRAQPPLDYYAVDILGKRLDEHLGTIRFVVATSEPDAKQAAFEELLREGWDADEGFHVLRVQRLGPSKSFKRKRRRYDG